MKKLCSIALIFVLTATVFTGCRGGSSTNPTTTAPGTSSTRPTVMPVPEIPLPTGTNTTAPGQDDPSLPGGTADPEGTPGVPGRMKRPSARGNRY